MSGNDPAGGRDGAETARTAGIGRGATDAGAPVMTAMAELVARQPRTWVRWWGAGTVVWERDAFGVVVARTDTAELAVSIILRAADDATTLVTVIRGADHVTGMAIACQNVAQRLAELVAGGWVMVACCHSPGGSEWGELRHPQTQAVEFSSPAAFIDGRNARRQLVRMHRRLEELPDSPWGPSSVAHIQEVQALAELLEDRGRDRLARLAMSLDTGLSALEAVARAEAAQRLLDTGQAASATEALRACA